MPNMQSAACHLVEVALSVRRDGNTDEFMMYLAETMNVICKLLGEGDGVSYNWTYGTFTLEHGVRWEETA